VQGGFQTQLGVRLLLAVADAKDGVGNGQSEQHEGKERGETPGGRGTTVTVLQEFRMGKLASAWETFLGRNPKQAVIENLRHFKALAETGEIPRTQTQPHGDRGVIGNMKASTYGEKIPTPSKSN